MTRDVQDELHGFAVALLERCGALVDWRSPAEDGVALLTPELAGALHAGEETIRLSMRASGGSELRVGLGTDFLDQAQRLLQSEPRIGTFRVPSLYLKRGKIDDAVRRAYTWLNAKVEVYDARSISVEYHTWWFRASLISEDRWETCFPVTINSASGGSVAFPDPLGLWEVEPNPAPSLVDPASTYSQAVSEARSQVQCLGREFLDRMASRLQRDRQRLHEYYNALLREAANKKPRGNATPEPEKLEARKRAVHLELRRKLAELEERYATEAVLEPIVLARTEMPGLAVDLLVHRKQARKVRTVFWNALLKELEPMRCSRCGAGTYSVSFANETVEALCSACAR